MERQISVISLKELNVMKMKMKMTDKIAFKGTTKFTAKANDASYWNALYYFVILIISILTTSMLTLFPRHNSIAYPKFW